MKFLFSVLCIVIIVSIGCKSKKSTNDSNYTPPLVTNDTSAFYDLNNFFATEIKDVAATPYFIYSITTTDENKRDSVAITSSKFEQIAQQFLTKDISQKKNKSAYKESIFHDLTTKTVNINYSTTDKSLEVQNIDILIDDETNKLRFVFIRAYQVTTDATIITQLNWKTGKNFLINKSVLKKDGTKTSIQQYVSWNE